VTRRYLISVSAKNRVGFLAAFAKALDELGGNLSEISQTRLPPYFMMLILAEFAESRDPGVIQSHIRDVCRPFGAELTIMDVTADPCDVESLDAMPDQKRTPFLLTMTGNDRPGILRLLTRQLAQHGIDVTNVRATQTDEKTRFLFVMSLSVPEGVSMLVLQNELQQIGEDCALSVHIQHGGLMDAVTSLRSLNGPS
jgi:predicted amino acid-binding ACT domain protein